MKCKCNNLDKNLQESSSKVNKMIGSGYVTKKVMDNYMKDLDHWIDKNVYGVHRGG
jgi:hypothetical protein